MRSFGLLGLILLAGCGSGDANKDTSSGDVVDWTDVAPIFTNTCAGEGSSCHSSGVANGGYNFAQITEADLPRARVLARVQSSEAPMPPDNQIQNPDEISLSEDNKLTLIRYLSQESY